MLSYVSEIPLKSHLQCSGKHGKYRVRNGFLPRVQRKLPHSGWGEGVTAPKLGCIPSLPLWEVFTINRNCNSFLKQKPALLQMHHIFRMYSAVAKTICTSTHTHHLFCSDFKSNMLFTESLKNRRIKKITGHF